jgi:hypothetical protein
MIDMLIRATVLITAFVFGWGVAHNTVATECKTLGGFYVGKTVYECKVKGETK